MPVCLSVLPARSACRWTNAYTAQVGAWQPGLAVPPLHHAAWHAAPVLAWHRRPLPVACACPVQLFFNQAQLKPDSAGKLKTAVPLLRCTLPVCTCRLACTAQQAARRASPALQCSLCVVSSLERRSAWTSSFLCAAVPRPPGAAAPPCLPLLPPPPSPLATQR